MTAGNKGVTTMSNILSISNFRREQATVSYITFLWKELQLWKCLEHVQLHGTHTSSIPTLETKELDPAYLQTSVSFRGLWYQEPIMRSKPPDDTDRIKVCISCARVAHSFIGKSQFQIRLSVGLVIIS